MPRKETLEPEKEEMVSIFDPVANAYREVPISVAKQWIESAKKLEEELGEE